MCASAVVVTSMCAAFPTRCVDGAMIKPAFGPGSMSAVVWWLVPRPVTRTTWVQFPAAVLCTHDPSIERPSIDSEGSRPQAIAVRPSVQSQCTVHARVTATTRASGSHRDLPGPAHGHGASACVPRVVTWTRTPRHVLGQRDQPARITPHRHRVARDGESSTESLLRPTCYSTHLVMLTRHSLWPAVLDLVRDRYAS